MRNCRSAISNPKQAALIYIYPKLFYDTPKPPNTEQTPSNHRNSQEMKPKCPPKSHNKTPQNRNKTLQTWVFHCCPLLPFFFDSNCQRPQRMVLLPLASSGRCSPRKLVLFFWFGGKEGHGGFYLLFFNMHFGFRFHIPLVVFFLQVPHFLIYALSVCVCVLMLFEWFLHGHGRILSW